MADSIIYITDTIYQSEFIYLQDSLTNQKLVNLGEIIEKVGAESTFLGVSHDAIFATLTSLFIFFVGFFIQRHLYNLKEKKKQKEIFLEKKKKKENLQKYFEASITELKKNVNALIKGYDNHYKGHTPLKSYHFTPPLSFNPEIEFISEINKELLFEVYSENGNIDDLRKKLSILDRFKAIVSLASKYQDMVYNQSINQYAIFDDISMHFFSSLDDLYDKTASSDIKKCISRFEDSVIKIYDNEKLLDFETQTQALKVLIKELFQIREIEDINNTIFIGKQFLVISKRMIELSNNFKGQYEHFSKNLNQLFEEN